MRKRRIIGAYCCAIFAGLIVFDIITIMLIAAIPLFSGETALSWKNLRDSSLVTIGVTLFALIFQFPIALLGALPFTAYFFSKVGRFWSISQKNFVLYGCLVPGLAMIGLTLVFFVNPSGGTAEPMGNWPLDYWPLGGKRSGNSIMDYIFPALTLSILAIPGGGVAGLIFWRIGFRNQELHQQKSNVTL
ncbi:hypothetical protein GOZ97_15870 [Agrobacterium vitis]|uniref:hypothetical protein n=1 Tax=Rhizobium/Agrobacterium group TaxID=227290 RepID=UPI0011133ED1|nr:MULTISPECIES: hypothetical protein [Rhizobium/Agrobacterium group]MCF1433638.1 hypothetical protein [Allorhizobium ampelinum]MUO91296.1 hypothetical protein [Agrobacterium vitis]MUZ53968.1 hypothetical protein [Agrobacterium vitis]MUZ92906.1 hypothetical protein [Agrobacterium vitis]MVA40718.1 hypothetical protein [Agrobacterium vitis]